MNKPTMTIQVNEQETRPITLVAYLELPTTMHNYLLYQNQSDDGMISLEISRVEMKSGSYFLTALDPEETPIIKSVVADLLKPGDNTPERISKNQCVVIDSAPLALYPLHYQDGQRLQINLDQYQVLEHHLLLLQPKTLITEEPKKASSSKLIILIMSIIVLVLAAIFLYLYFQ